MTRLSICVWAALVVSTLLSGASSSRREVTVCSGGCDYSTIQSAVDLADPGQTLVLGPERFTENVRIVDRDLVIRGTDPSTTIVDGSGAAVVFELINRPHRSVTLSHMTIENGLAGVQGGGRIHLHDCVVQDNGPGGGMVSFADSVTTLEDCVFQRNSGNYGGGISAGGEVRLVRSKSRDNLANYGGGLAVGGSVEATACTLEGNTASEVGGGLINRYGEVTITRSEISSNQANWGAGIYNEIGQLSLAYSAVVGNTAQYAGGIFSSVGLPPCGADGPARLTITTSTISGNAAQASGSAIYGTGDVFISSSTIAGNSSSQGGALYASTGTCPNDFTLSRSVIADNQGPNCDPASRITSLGFNQSDDVSCDLPHPTDGSGQDAQLLPLGDNGGSTPTHAIDANSPLLDAAGSSCEATDQRGAPRPVDGNGDGVVACDTGAYERGPLVQLVSLDVKPHGSSNNFNPRSRGLVGVALLGDEYFDPSSVDVFSLRFGPDGAEPAHRLDDAFVFHQHLQDTNRDGFGDLVVHFRSLDTGITCGMTAAALTGSTTSGLPFEGSGPIRTVGCR